MSALGNHMPGRLTPPKFATEMDRDMFEYAQGRIEAGEDLEFYSKPMNDGFVLSPGGKREQIRFR